LPVWPPFVPVSLHLVDITMGFSRSRSSPDGSKNVA